MLKTAGLSTSGLAIILIVYRVLKTIKGKRLVSSCCGKKLEMGIDVEEITPKQIVIHNPSHKRESPEKTSTSISAIPHLINPQE
jgi:hypothetical protein